VNREQRKEHRDQDDSKPEKGDPWRTADVVAIGAETGDDLALGARSPIAVL